MVALNKIDSNDTNTRYAVEESIGVLPANPVWLPLEPNSFSDFGGNATLVARNPINNSRQRRKGVITDLDASGGLEQDFTQTNLQDILQGFMFADFRRKAEQDVSAVAADTMTVADGTAFKIGDIVKGADFAETANNVVFDVTGVTGNDLTVPGAVADTTGRIVCVGTSAAAGDIDVDADGTWPALVSTTLDFTTLGLSAGEWLFVGGDDAGTSFVTVANNGFKRVSKIEANRLEFDISSAPMATEDGAALSIKLYFGRFLRNEQRDKIKRRTYQIERTLGKPDTTDAADQSEYLVGAVPSEFSFNFGTADKAVANLSFVAIDNEQRSADDGPKLGDRPALTDSDLFNTSSDFSEIKMNIWTPGAESPSPLFGYLQEMSVTINNNLSPNKALGVLGAFEVTAGTFQVSGAITAYFTDVAAVQAVRNNSDVTMHAILAKDNAGVILDLPLVALGNGRLNVVIDQPITLPLSMDAAEASRINPAVDYTAAFVFFDYLPTMAEV